MTCKAYIDNIRAQTGRTPKHFVAPAKVMRLVKMTKWLQGTAR